MFPDEFLRKNTEWLEKVSNYFTIKPNRYDEFVDHFKVEKGKGRAEAYLKSLTNRQIHDGDVWRMQQSSLGYQDFFDNGITPGGNHDNILRHTESNTTPGNFISTSTDKTFATNWGAKNGWVFEIRSTKGIDVNKTLGDDALHPAQFEVSVPDGVLAKDIKGVWEKKDYQLIKWIANPNYVP